MLVMGVATWMFRRTPRDRAFDRLALAEIVYWIMTGATALRALSELFAPSVGAPILRILIVTGGLGQLVGTACSSRTCGREFGCRRRRLLDLGSPRMTWILEEDAWNFAVDSEPAERNSPKSCAFPAHTGLD